MDNIEPGKAYVFNEETKTWEPVKETPNKWIPSQRARRWIFTVLGAFGPIVVFYGLASAEEVALWIGLASTVLVTPALALAEQNVPR